MVRLTTLTNKYKKVKLLVLKNVTMNSNIVLYKMNYEAR